MTPTLTLTTTARPAILSGLAGRVAPFLPGLALTTVLAAAALTIQRAAGIPGLSPLVVAMGLGIAIRNGFGPVAGTAPGITFALRRVLRIAIVLLGFQITLGQVAAIGPAMLAAIAATLVASFLFTSTMARLLGVDRKLGQLIAAGTSICGASAIIACNAATRGSDEDVAYAVATVAVFGTLLMVAFPLLAGPLGLQPQIYGLWVGATVHEVAQVVAAAFAEGEVAGQAGTVAKLARVMLLAPMVVVLGALSTRRGAAAGAPKAPLPWFAFGFLAVAGLNSTVALPAAAAEAIATTTSALLTLALAAMGLETDIRKLARKGLRPLVLAGLGTLFIAATGLGLVTLAA